ncbi:MAG TPA: TonB-dependent receptor, partial [Candidatus Solibacter sp.]|nr:TonB-dependent receptor [Candidatus Solibacter sp.]
MRLRALCLPVALLLLLASASALAQSTALLTGTVIDPSGAAVVQANVVCWNTETDWSVAAVTNSSGLFRCPDLPVGLYEVRIVRAGFSTLIRSGIQLLTGQTVDLTYTLQLGQTNQSIEVTAPAPLVQRATSDLGTIVDSRQVTELPLNGRNVFDLAELAPGAIETVAATIPGQQDNNGMAVNGNRSVDNNWQLDGGTYTNRNWGSAPTLPNPDTIQEFSVRTSNFDAANRGAGASIKLTTRSGTNQMHGTIFEFVRNDIADARNFFDTRVEPYKQNQYGGTAGGPIRKDRLFFFGSFQGTNQRGAPSPRSMTVPDAFQRTGDYSRSGKTIVDPATGAPFPGDAIPRARMDSIALGLIPYVPLPNYSGNRLYASPYANLDDYQWLARIDYSLGSRDHFFGRYFWDQNTRQRDVASIPGIYANNQYNNQTIMVSDTHTFSPSWLITASFNYLRTFRNETPVAPLSMQQLGAKVPCASGNDCGNKIYVQLSGYTNLAISGGGISQPEAEEAVAEVSHQSGRHFIRFGASYRHTSDWAFGLNDSEAGNWSFDATRTSSASIKNSGDSYASFFLGLPTTFAQATSTPNNFLVSTGDAFLQDDWKIAPRLTLNLGLRYEPWLFPHDGRGFLPGFLPGRQSQIAPLAPLGLVFTGDYGLPPSIVRSNWKTFSPRFGLAWDVFGDGKTIFRGGFGIFRTSTEFFGMVSTAAGSVPFRTASVSITNPPSTADPYAGYGPVPFPYTVPSSLANYKFPANTAIRTMDPATRAGYIESWNATLERQVTHDTAITVSFVGNHGLGIMNRYQNNPGLCCYPGMPSAVNSRRLYPGFGNLTIQGSFGRGKYEALQLQVNKRAGHGLTLLANYTYGKAMGIDSSGAFGTALSTAPRDPYNLSLDY